MAASSRIKANSIIFKIGGVDYAYDTTKVSLELSDADGGAPRTFCQPEAEQQYQLSIEGTMSGQAASLYRALYAAYETDVAFILAPGGNATASATQPHYTGTVTINNLPPIALDPGQTAVFSVQLRVINSVHTPGATPRILWGVTELVA
jgi:hypothetical protein